MGQNIIKGEAETCEVCKRPNIITYEVPDEVWAQVAGPHLAGGVLCLTCFGQRAAYRGVAWVESLKLIRLVTQGGESRWLDNAP